MKEQLHPMAITMWDFSWIERRWDGAGFENWDEALDGVAERGYDAVHTIQDADMILVFGDGKIVERGDHNTLLKQNGVYASMWNEYQTQITWKVGKPQRKEANHD